MTEASAHEGSPESPRPTECDVCHGVISPASDYATMTIVYEATPRPLRDRHGGILEEEWKLSAVCAPCIAQFQLWLFREPAEELAADELDTLPPPPVEPGDANETETHETEAEPVSDSFTGAGPNHS